MAPFRLSLLGYRRAEVEIAINARDQQIFGIQGELTRSREALTAAEREATELAGMVIERERELHVLDGRLREAQQAHERSISSLDAVSARLEEMNAQARGQATRIRMKALREAVEVSKRVQALEDAAGGAPNGNGGSATPTASSNGSAPHPANGFAPAEPIDFDGLFEGRVRLEIGPLGDFSQLVGFEDAIGELGASEISVERFSEGRATLSLHLDEPIDLLRELEGRSAQDFNVRHTAPDNLVIDLDDDSDAEQHAA
jgi:hypothetical protein